MTVASDSDNQTLGETVPMAEDTILQLTSTTEQDQNEREGGEKQEQKDPQNKTSSRNEGDKVSLEDDPATPEILPIEEMGVELELDKKETKVEPLFNAEYAAKNSNKVISKLDADNVQRQTDRTTTPARTLRGEQAVASDTTSTTAPTQLVRNLPSRRQESTPGAVAVSYARGVNNTSDGMDTESWQTQDPEAPLETEPVQVRNSNQLVSAVRVEIQEEEIREEMRQELLHEAVQADVVDQKEPPMRSIVVGSVLLILALGIGLAVGLSPRDNVNELMKNQTSQSAGIDLATWRPRFEGPTFTDVQNRGFIRCGIYNNSYGFSYINEEKDGNPREGMNLDQVRNQFDWRSMFVYDTMNSPIFCSVVLLHLLH